MNSIRNARQGSAQHDTTKKGAPFGAPRKPVILSGASRELEQEFTLPATEQSAVERPLALVCTFEHPRQTTQEYPIPYELLWTATISD
jgi:hypothetical protein